MSGLRNTALQGLALACAAIATACQPAPPPGRAAEASHPGLAFARSSCGGCHALDQRSVSPNPNAPPFAAVVNQEGLTRNTLAAWLRNAHNYPAEMKLTLDQRRVDDISAYMLTLRDPNFRPAT